VIIGERCAATTIDKNSTVNLISIEVVEKLHLAARASKVPYLLHSSYGTLLISHMAEVPFTFGGHTEVVHFGVSQLPLDSCHIPLGYPWCHNYQVQPCRDVTKVVLQLNSFMRIIFFARRGQRSPACCLSTRS
jgi:hypothetical protein